MVSLNGTNLTFLRSKNAQPTYSSRRGYQFRSAATEHVEALSARFFTFLWLVTYLCRFCRNIEFIMSYMCHRQAMTHCARSNSLLKAKSTMIQAGSLLISVTAGKLPCTMFFKGFVATFCQSLRTFCITQAKTRRNDIFGVEFPGRNLSLSAVHCISSPYKCLSSRCCHIYSSKPTFYCLQPKESSNRSSTQFRVTHCGSSKPHTVRITLFYQEIMSHLTVNRKRFESTS